MKNRKTLLCVIGKMATIGFVLMTSYALAQENEQVIYASALQWKITMPKELAADAVATIDMENRTTPTADFTETTQIVFAFRNGIFNSMEAQTQPLLDGQGNVGTLSFFETKQLLIKVLSEQLPEVKIDTLSKTEKIDGLEFELLYTRITYPNKLVVHGYLFNRMVNGINLTINTTFSDEAVGEKMLSSIKNSKFNVPVLSPVQLKEIKEVAKI